MVFVILGNCTLSLHGVLRLAFGLAFVFAAAPCPRPWSEWSFPQVLALLVSSFLFWRWNHASDYGPRASGSKGCSVRYEHPTYLTAEVTASQFLSLLPVLVSILQTLLGGYVTPLAVPLLPDAELGSFMSLSFPPVFSRLQVSISRALPLFPDSSGHAL